MTPALRLGVYMDAVFASGRTLSRQMEQRAEAGLHLILRWVNGAVLSCADLVQCMQVVIEMLSARCETTLRVASDKKSFRPAKTSEETQP